MKISQIVFCLLILGSIFSQTLVAQNGEECGTVFTEEMLQHFKRTLEERQDLSQLNDRNNTIYIPIWNHIVRRDNGTGGVSATRVDELMEDLNSAFLPGGIQFYECRTRNWINNTDYYILGDGGGAAPSQFKDFNLLNIYYVGGMSKCGFAANGSGGLPGHVVVKKSCIDNFGSTLVHEVGHYLSLIHTHGPQNNSMTLELADGSNCVTFGDDVCDTPADPGLKNRTNNNCQYTGTDTDANGQAYTPMVQNFMSYAPKSCRNTFTPGQLARMRHSAQVDYDFICTTCQDSWVETDAFDFGEDRTTHNYQTNGGVSYPAAASCGTDEGVAVGGPQGTGWIELRIAVLPGTHQIKVRLKAFFVSAFIVPDIYLDGELYVDSNPMPPAPNCTDGISTPCDDMIEIELDNIARHTQDGFIVLRVADNQPGCGADFVFNQLWVSSFDECDMVRHAPLPYSTGFENGNDGYWRTFSGNEAGLISFTNMNMPATGNFHLTMQSNESGNTGSSLRSVSNKADLYVDLSSCNNVILDFDWKHFGDVYNASHDGVFFSDNGGLDFVKVHDLRPTTAFNTWDSRTLNVSSLASANGLSLTDKFIIRFQQLGNRSIRTTSPATSNGFAFDNVAVTCSSGPAPRTGNGTESKTEASLNVFPNPVNETASLEINLTQTSEVTLAVYDCFGRAVLNVMSPTIRTAGKHHLTFNVQDWNNGVYLCVLSVGEEQLVKKIVVQR